MSLPLPVSPITSGDPQNVTGFFIPSNFLRTDVLIFDATIIFFPTSFWGKFKYFVVFHIFAAFVSFTVPTKPNIW